MHVFPSIKLGPQRDSLGKNPKTQAVWLIKCYFNSWIGTRPSTEHKQMDIQCCRAPGSAGQQVLLDSTFHTLTSNPHRLLSKVHSSSGTTVPLRTRGIKSKLLSDAIRLPTQVTSQHIKSILWQLEQTLIISPRYRES